MEEEGEGKGGSDLAKRKTKEFSFHCCVCERKVFGKWRKVIVFHSLSTQLVAQKLKVKSMEARIEMEVRRRMRREVLKDARPLLSLTPGSA